MPYGYYYGFDWTYLVIVLPCLLLSLIASARVNSTFKKYSDQYSRRNITGADAAQRVRQLMEEGLSRKDAVKQTAKELDLPKNVVYDAALQDAE